jgi:hypothetical protein
MTTEDFLLNLLYSTLATILGGGILTLIFFLLREKAFPVPRISGMWFFEMKTIKSDFNPYKDMILHYVAILCIEGNKIEGTVEKIYEKSSTGERSYDGKNRTRGIVNGFIEKNYFSKDRALLHIIEDGHGRESTHFYEVIIRSNSEMDGTFNSMVAHQDGETTWKRKRFLN